MRPDRLPHRDRSSGKPKFTLAEQGPSTDDTTVRDDAVHPAREHLATQARRRARRIAPFRRLGRFRFVFHHARLSDES